MVCKKFDWISSFLLTRMCSHDLIIALRSVGTKSYLDRQVQWAIRDLGIQCLHRGCRAGRHARRRTGYHIATTATETETFGKFPFATAGPSNDVSHIPVIVGRRQSADSKKMSRDPSPRMSVLTAVTTHHRVVTTASPQHAVSPMPTLYVLNAAALSKPGAVDHLAADLKSTDASVAVIISAK